MKIYDVFISYRRRDGLTIAEALYKYLTSKGLRVFFDKHEMIDGHYFTTQIETNLKIAPNYILVATDDVFKFRKKEDWVCKEIEVAIEEYEANPIERTLTVLVPESVTFPEKEALPQSVCNIADAQRIALPYGEDFAEPFYKTLKAVTNINRRNIWFAAHRWLENSKQPGGRFASLNINESILPNASKNKIEQKAMPINVYSKENESENRQSLLDAMGCNSNHLYLIGQGGIGKTTALMHIMNNAYVDKQYSENAQIPLFVELSFAPDTYGALYEGSKSSFIRRSIYKQVRADRTIKQVTAKEVSDVDEVFSSLPYDVAVQPITDILSKTTPAPEYLLLLDGLNEVSSVTIEETGLSVVQMIMREIDLLISECPNVRVVLTSRSDESAIYNESISRLYLSGVEDSKIKDYLESFELSKEQIDKVLEDENLNKTLQIPLFLTMYASLSKYDEVSTQGEILKLFFNERRKNISVYTMQERLSQVEKNITDVASAVQKNRIDADMQNFILDFILPEIAWFLERNGEFYLSVRSIRKIVEPILVDTDDLAFCGEFGREIFSKYRNGASAKMHTYKVAKRIFERLGDDITEVAESIVNCCVFAFGIMQESNGKYGFIHQHIRDYFAALKTINTIRLAVYLYEEDEKELALECMNKAFKDEPVNYTVRRFMGEYLGEHRNKPYYANEKWNYGVPTEKCDRNLIKRTLDIYRGYFDGETGYGIYSLIQILKEIRCDLSGEVFSRLDLTNCNFNGFVLGNNMFGAVFEKALIQYENFMQEKHSSVIVDIFVDEQKEYLVTLSTDGYAKVWNIKSFLLIKTFITKIYSPKFKCVNDKLWVVGSEKCVEVNLSTLTLNNYYGINGQNKELKNIKNSSVEELCYFDERSGAEYFYGKKNIFATYHRLCITFRDKVTKQKINSIKCHTRIKSLKFIERQEKSVILLDDGTIVIFDIKNNSIAQKVNLWSHSDIFSDILFDDKILIISSDGVVRKWDAQDRKIYYSTVINSSVQAVGFSNNKKLFAVLDDYSIWFYKTNNIKLLSRIPLINKQSFKTEEFYRPSYQEPFVTFSINDSYVAMVLEDQSVYILDFIKKGLYNLEQNFVTLDDIFSTLKVDVSEKQQIIVTTTDYGKTSFYNIDTMKKIESHIAILDTYESKSFYDGKFIYDSFPNGAIQVFDNQFSLVCDFSIDDSYVHGIYRSHNGSFVIIVYENSNIYLIENDIFNAPKFVYSLQDEIIQVTFDFNDKKVLVVTATNKLIILDIINLRILDKMQFICGLNIQNVTFSDDTFNERQNDIMKQYGAIID